MNTYTETIQEDTEEEDLEVHTLEVEESLGIGALEDGGGKVLSEAPKRW
jgi:hypothetical protein